MAETLERVDGVVIGVLIGFADGVPLVIYAGNPRDAAAPARSLAALGHAQIGSEVALLFEEGDPGRPLVIGCVVDPGRPRGAPVVLRDGEHVRVTAAERIELRVGKASLIMEKDGRITLRGSYVTSHASAAMRIRGGSVNLN